MSELDMGSESKAPDVFEFQDYRQYLKAVFEFKKSNKPGYSLKNFAASLGFSSHSGLAMILSGQRNLRQPYLDKCIRWLKLPLKQRLYFEAMVNGDGLSPARRRQLTRNMEFLKNKWAPPEAPDIPSLFDFGMVHQLLCLHRRYMSPEEILSELSFVEDKKYVLKILDYMLDRGMVKRSPVGHFKIEKAVLIAEDEVPSTSARQMHHECLDRAHTALESTQLEEREFQTYMMTVSSKDIPKIKKAIKKSVMEIINKYESDLDGDTIIQVHSHMLELINRTRGSDED